MITEEMTLMIDNQAWDAFEKTGSIEAYLLFRRIKEVENDVVEFSEEITDIKH